MGFASDVLVDELTHHDGDQDCADACGGFTRDGDCPAVPGVFVSGRGDSQGEALFEGFFFSLAQFAAGYFRCSFFLRGFFLRGFVMQGFFMRSFFTRSVFLCLVSVVFSHSTSLLSLTLFLYQCGTQHYECISGACRYFVQRIWGVYQPRNISRHQSADLNLRGHLCGMAPCGIEPNGV